MHRSGRSRRATARSNLRAVTYIGWLGVWLLVASTVVILIELAVMGLWTGRLARRAGRLSVRLASERALLQADAERLRLALIESELLWQPFGRILRWLRHPLVAALLVSLQRRVTAR